MQTADAARVAYQYRAVWLVNLLEVLLEVQLLEGDIDRHELALGPSLELDDLRRRVRRVRANWLQHLPAVLTTWPEIRH
jgi:hypothetical protein